MTQCVFQKTTTRCGEETRRVPWSRWVKNQLFVLVTWVVVWFKQLVVSEVTTEGVCSIETAEELDVRVGCKCLMRLTLQCFMGGDRRHCTSTFVFLWLYPCVWIFMSDEYLLDSDVQWENLIICLCVSLGHHMCTSLITL